MEKYQHLKLPVFQENVERKKNGGGGFSLPPGRNKSQFANQARQQAKKISESFAASKKQFSDRIDPTLIFEIEINQGVDPKAFEDTLASMNIKLLSIAEGKKGFWVVFSEDEELDLFKKKLTEYGSEEGYAYKFFHAIESFGDISVEKKIGKRLTENPLAEVPDFIDLELWRMTDPQRNELFIDQLKTTYNDLTKFRITDTLIAKSFVLLRVKLIQSIFEEIIQLKEIARADRPALVQFNPITMRRPDVQDIMFQSPDVNAAGILVIDSGITANHPMLEHCVGGEENFQSGEKETQDTVGHGTAVAGCAVYGDVENSLEEKVFSPSNWLFSAKVMYAKEDWNGQKWAVYDPKKLIEHQLKDAVVGFLSNSAYHIRVINISLGNKDEIWHKHYFRQRPLAALIDELAFTFPHVVFVVSTGNQRPLDLDQYFSIEEVLDNYPQYLVSNEEFKIINPASAALALTVGSIAGQIRSEKDRYGGPEQIKTAIAQPEQPSPFTRTGCGINGMVKPELVEYGGNLILSEQYGRITEDTGGKLALLNNKVTDDILQFDIGSSFAAPKVAHLAGKIANHCPGKSANFIKNMLLVGADYPFVPDKHFYGSIPKRIGIKKYENTVLQKLSSAFEKKIFEGAYWKSKKYYILHHDITEDVRKELSNTFKKINFDSQLKDKDHLSVCGYGLSHYEKSLYSFENRAVLWDEGQLALNQIKVYSLQLPDLFFSEAGRKKISVVLTFTPETRATRGDSYLGNRMEFHLFHSQNPQTLVEKYGQLGKDLQQRVPDDLKTFEIDLFPGANTRKAGCHQKAWKIYQREPINRPKPPISLVLLNINKWITDTTRKQDYCLSVTFEHEKATELYNAVRANLRTRTKVR
ncbi:MAG: hypothetical protein D3925_03570 [Candidatus Electrothrix sp. AR5]|nr:hypothetical protein [Candidatus Electrothrix sp. AR5]